MSLDVRQKPLEPTVSQPRRFHVATITLKDIPDALHIELKSRARFHGRSLNKEILRCLQSSISTPRVEIEKVLASVDRVREDGVRLDGDLMDAALKSGRP